MPADRLTHPRIGRSRKVTTLTDLEFRVWDTYRWVADDFGVMPKSAVTLRGENDALRDQHTDAEVAAALQRLIDVDLIVEFDHQGAPFVCSLTWIKHQKITYPRQTHLPAPPPQLLDRMEVTERKFFRNFHEFFRKSRASRARAGGKRLMLTANANATGEESEKGGRRQRAPSRGLQRRGDLQANFARFWAAYPHKVGKDAALRAFRTLRPDNELTDRMVAAVEQHGASEQWRKDGGQFIPHPKTWLREGRWQDEGVTRSAPEASVDLKRLLWRALRPEDGRVWLDHATVAREGSRVRLCTVAPAKLQPAHAALQAALRAQAGADLSLEIVGVGGDA